MGTIGFKGFGTPEELFAAIDANPGAEVVTISPSEILVPPELLATCLKEARHMLDSTDLIGALFMLRMVCEALNVDIDSVIQLGAEK